MFQTQENPLGLPRGSTVAFVRTRWRCVSPRVAARAPRRKAGWPPRGYNNNTWRSSSAFHRRPYGRRISLSTPVFWGQRRWRPLRHCCHLPCLNSEAPWIPAFAGISHVGLTPHTTTDESWRAGRAPPSAGSGQASPGSGAWVPVSSTRMTEGGAERTFEAMTEGVMQGPSPRVTRGAAARPREAPSRRRPAYTPAWSSSRRSLSGR